MTIAGLLVFLVVAGVVLAMFPVDPTIRKVIVAVIVVLALVLLLRLFGLV